MAGHSGREYGLGTIVIPGWQAGFWRLPVPTFRMALAMENVSVLTNTTP
jgi:hypothetical protein